MALAATSPLSPTAPGTATPPAPKPPDVLPFDWTVPDASLEDMFLQVSYLSDLRERAAAFPDVDAHIAATLHDGLRALHPRFTPADPDVVLKALEAYNALPTLRGVVDAYPTATSLHVLVVALVGRFAIADHLRVLIDDHGILDRFMTVVRQGKDPTLAQAMLEVIEAVKSTSASAVKRPMSRRQLKFMAVMCDAEEPFCHDVDTAKFLMGTVYQLLAVEDNTKALVGQGLVPALVAMADIHAASPVGTGAVYRTLHRLFQASAAALEQYAAGAHVLKQAVSALLEHGGSALVQAQAGQVVTMLLKGHEAEGAAYIRGLGGVDHCLMCLGKYPDDPDVLRSSLRLLQQMLSDDQTRYSIANGGGAATLADICRRHMDKPLVLAEAFDMIAVLMPPVSAWLLKNKVGAGGGHILTLGVHDLVLSALREYGDTYGETVAGGVHCLAESAVHFPRGRRTLLDAGVVPAVLAAMDAQPWVIAVQLHGVRLLGAMAQDPTPDVDAELHVAQMMELRVPSGIIAGVRRHPHSDAVNHAGRLALWQYALRDDRALKKYRLLVHKPPPVRVGGDAAAADDDGEESGDSDFER